MCGSRIPYAHAMQNQTRYCAFYTMRIAAFSQVAMLQVPGISHRRVNVCDMDLIRPRYHAFRDGIAARNDQVIFGEIELLDRERREGGGEEERCWRTRE